jgi:hypothetical protein
MAARAGAGHRWLVEKDVGSLQPRRPELIAVGCGHLRAELFQRQEVRVDPATTDHVTARRREGHPSAASKHRTRQQDRCPDVGAEHGIEFLGSHFLRLDLQGVVAGPICRRPN